MNKNDYQKFIAVYQTAHEIMPGGKKFSDDAMLMIINILHGYDIKTLIGAINHHVKTSKFAPSPADIIDIINSTIQSHIGADEAWSIAIESFDESSTVVWTKEIATARAVAYEIYNSGDAIGARMAFKDTYNRITKGTVPNWTICLGFDQKRRVDAIKKSIDLGRLPKDASDNLKLETTKQTVTGLIENIKKTSALTEEKKAFALDNLKSIKEKLNNEQSS